MINLPWRWWSGKVLRNITPIETYGSIFCDKPEVWEWISVSLWKKWGQLLLLKKVKENFEDGLNQVHRLFLTDHTG